MSSDCWSKFTVWIHESKPLLNVQFEFATMVNCMEFYYNSFFSIQNKFKTRGFEKHLNSTKDYERLKLVEIIKNGKCQQSEQLIF